MGSYKKSVFMRDSGMVSISIGELQFFQLGREDARELAEMLLKVVDSPLTVDEQQAQARIMPAKDGSGVWYYTANETIDERVLQELSVKATNLDEESMIREFIEEREEND